jgi:hypothetical protein
MNERAQKNLSACIQTMRDACDDAERRVRRARSDHEAAREVLHALMWGMANASSSLENAMDAAEDADLMAKEKR